MNDSKPRLIVCTGLAGVGKTHARNQFLENELQSGGVKESEILILSFNSFIRAQAIATSNVELHESIHTVHSLAFRILKELDKLPEVFHKKEKNTLKTKDFDNLLKLFLKLEIEEIRAFLPTVKLILIDEYQDLAILPIKVIQNLQEIYEPDFYIAIDPFQRIYGYSGKILDNFNNLESDFGLYPQIEFLNINHRISNYKLLEFLNDSLLRMYGENIRPHLYRMNALQDISENCYQTHMAPQMRYFTDQKDEYCFVRKQVESLSSGKRIVILGRWKRGLQQYKDMGELPNVEVSTIHKYKGLEADIVFMIGVNPQQIFDSDDEKNVFYVGISRACEKLFISTAHPKEKGDWLLSPERVLVINEQQARVSPIRIRKGLKRNVNFSMRKLAASNIDSLDLKVSSDFVPFPMHVEHNAPASRLHSRSQEIEAYGVKYTVVYHFMSGQYFFQFRDLTFLTKNGYTNKHKIDFCLNQIYAFFDYRIDRDVIIPQRVDLCRYYFCKDEDAFSFMKEAIEHELRRQAWERQTHSNLGSVKHSMEKRRGINTHAWLSMSQEERWKHTSYINCSGKILMRIYLPLNKEKHAIHIPNVIKEEIEMRGDALRLSRSPVKCFSVDDLYALNDESFDLLRDFYVKKLGGRNIRK